MTLFRVAAAVQVAGSAVIAWCVVRHVGWAEVRFLYRHGAQLYALGLAWVVVAPTLLLTSALVARRAPWPWVVVTTLHLAVIVAAATRLRRLAPDVGWAVLALVVVIGVVSVVTAVREHVEQRT